MRVIGGSKNRRDEAERTHNKHDQEADDEPRDEFVEARSAFRRRTGAGRRQFCGQQRKTQHYRPEHQHAHELNDCSDLLLNSPIGKVAASTCGTA